MSTPELKSLKFALLLNEDKQEASKLLQAAENEGFFYLDFATSSEGERILKIVEDISALQEVLFNETEEEKLRYDIDKLDSLKLNGYKPKGRNVTGINGKRDGFESWTLPKDGVLEKTSFVHPPVVDEHIDTLRLFMRSMQDVTHVVHQSLSRSLSLTTPGKRLEDYHRASHPSPCILRLLKYHASVLSNSSPPQTAHTDLGSLTALFTQQPGLQVRLGDGDSATWTYINPRPGCAVFNIGDGVAMLTGNRLRSALHRVMPMPGQAMRERYSFAYLQRAEADMLMRPLFEGDTTGEEKIAAGQVLTSEQWLRKKFSALRAKSYNEKTSTILTGREGLVNL